MSKLQEHTSDKQIDAFTKNDIDAALFSHDKNRGLGKGNLIEEFALLPFFAPYKKTTEWIGNITSEESETRNTCHIGNNRYDILVKASTIEDRSPGDNKGKSLWRSLGRRELDTLDFLIELATNSNDLGVKGDRFVLPFNMADLRKVARKKYNSQQLLMGLETLSTCPTIVTGFEGMKKVNYNEPLIRLATAENTESDILDDTRYQFAVSFHTLVNACIKNGSYFMGSSVNLSDCKSSMGKYIEKWLTTKFKHARSDNYIEIYASTLLEHASYGYSPSAERCADQFKPIERALKDHVNRPYNYCEETSRIENHEQPYRIIEEVIPKPMMEGKKKVNILYRIRVTPRFVKEQIRSNAIQTNNSLIKEHSVENPDISIQTALRLNTTALKKDTKANGKAQA